MTQNPLQKRRRPDTCIRQPSARKVFEFPLRENVGFKNPTYAVSGRLAFVGRAFMPDGQTSENFKMSGINARPAELSGFNKNPEAV